MDLAGPPAPLSQAPRPPQLWWRQNREKTHREAGAVSVRWLLGSGYQRGCKWPAVGRDPRSERHTLAAAEVWRGRRPEGPGAPFPGLLIPLPSPPSRPTPRASLVFWKYFQVLQQYPAHSLPLPPGAAVRAGKVLAPNPAKLLLTCVLCVPQTFHSAVASEARNPC